MAFVTPQFTKSQVNKAGDLIVRSMGEVLAGPDYMKAWEVLTNWRASHGYPMKALVQTGNDTLRKKVLDAVEKVAAEVPSIERAWKVWDCSGGNQPTVPEESTDQRDGDLYLDPA